VRALENEWFRDARGNWRDGLLAVSDEAANGHSRSVIASKCLIADRVGGNSRVAKLS